MDLTEAAVVVRNTEPAGPFVEYWPDGTYRVDLGSALVVLDRDELRRLYDSIEPVLVNPEGPIEDDDGPE